MGEIPCSAQAVPVAPPTTMLAFVAESAHYALTPGR